MSVKLIRINFDSYTVTNKICLPHTMWLRSTIGSSPQLLSGRYVFELSRSLNFFKGFFSEITLIADHMRVSLRYL